MAKPKRTKQVKRGVWFVRVRGSYLPVTKEGWLSYIPFAVLAVLPLKAVVLATNCPKSQSIFCDNPSVMLVASRVVLPATMYYLVLALAMTLFAKGKS
jgi:branched-subunit amino acid transport protein